VNQEADRSTDFPPLLSAMHTHVGLLHCTAKVSPAIWIVPRADNWC